LNSESPNTSSPTVAQLHDARLHRWHQAGEALLTVENLRSWINAAGFVLFTPRPQIVAPAPSLIEAVLGAPSPEPTLDQIAEASGLLARLVAEGVALPLNLMGAHGTPGDTPDFVVSAAVFSYVFTLRGDKGWKQPPATSGPVKVSNLALATYEAISSKGPMSAYDLATQLGKEVTEAACLRAVNELWTHLRVFPVTQRDGRATVWELTSTRFSKQIKAGTNAGLPTAVSALISLYLGQVMAASEDEIESLLSPLAPRSRIREVAHALLNARQIETLVIDGKTLLHLAGDAPSFTAAEALPAEEVEATAMEAASQTERVEGASRITKYVPRPRKIGTGYLAKGKPAAGKRPFARGDSRGRSEGFKPRTGARDDRERRPFRKPVEGAPERRFDRPWQEERPRRSAEGGARSPRKPRPASGEQGGGTREFRSRPPRRDDNGLERRPPRGNEGFKPRRESAGRFDRREASAGPFHKRPERRDRDAAAGSERPAFRRFDAPRADRPKNPPAGERPERRPRTGDSDRRPPRRDGEFRPGAPRREGEFKPRSARPGGDAKPRSPRRDGDFKPTPRRDEGGFEGRPPRRESSFEGRPAKKQGGNRPSGKSKFGGGPAKFAKSPGKKKPFQKKPSDRSFRPRRDESA
jgi:23S rRNA pseudouridine2605 synthase